MWQKTKGRVHCALFVRKSCEQNWNGKRLVAMLREIRYAQVIRSKMHRGKFSKAAHSTRDHSDRKHFTFFLKEAQTFAIYSFRVQHHSSILPAVCVRSPLCCCSHYWMMMMPLLLVALQPHHLAHKFHHLYLKILIFRTLRSIFYLRLPNEFENVEICMLCYVNGHFLVVCMRLFVPSKANTHTLSLSHCIGGEAYWAVVGENWFSSLIVNSMLPLLLLLLP